MYTFMYFLIRYKLLFLNDPLKKAQAQAFLSGEPYVPDYLKQVPIEVNK